MGSGYRVFTAGEVLSASNVQNYLQDQAVMVFGGTAARSSAIGTANFEEGMLTYLTDVDKLQVYTGAAFADVYPAASSNQGLTLINTTSFSAVSSVSLSTSLLTGYKGYRVLYTFTNSGNNNPSLRVRSASTDDTSGNYGSQIMVSNDALMTSESSGTATSWNNFGTTSGASRKTCVDVELWDLNLASATFGFTNYIRFIDESSTNKVYRRGGINHNVATAYDGLTLIASTGTITGDYKVWGFNG